MAFQDKTQNAIIKLNDMKEGDVYECYPVKAFTVSLKNGEATNIQVVNAETNEVETINTPGNVKYAYKEGRLTMGQLTRFTRLEDRKYGSLKGSAHKIEQDPDDVLSDELFEKVEAGVPEEAPAVSNKQLAADKVKQAAEQLAAQAQKRG